MKDISISHIVTERNVVILPCGGPQDPEYQKNDTWVRFLKFSEPTKSDAISSCDGAAIRKQRQRERIGAMTLHGLLHTRMSLHVAEYFSIVRRSPCCAGLLSRSTSLSTTTLNAGGAAALALSIARASP